MSMDDKYELICDFRPVSRRISETVQGRTCKRTERVTNGESAQNENDELTPLPVTTDAISTTAECHSAINFRTTSMDSNRLLLRRRIQYKLCCNIDSAVISYGPPYLLSSLSVLGNPVVAYDGRQQMISLDLDCAFPRAVAWYAVAVNIRHRLFLNSS